MTVKRIKLSDQIRQAIETCGKTRYQVSRDKSISTATLCRFVKGQAGLLIPVIDEVCDCLGLRLTQNEPRAAARKTKKGR